jgi:battenin
MVRPVPAGKATYLTTGEKLALMRPLVLRYMLPLCAVYIEEYIINSVGHVILFRGVKLTSQGVAPTLVFPIPTEGPWSVLFKSPRDYYPFWSLTCTSPALTLLISDQSFVFLSRSSLSLGLPPIPKRLLPVPTIIQFFVLLLLSLQASRFIFASSVFTPPNEPPSQGVDRSITVVFLLMCLEGMCGGSAYVNTFYWVGREGEDGEDEGEEGAKRKMEKEFRIGATGASDSLGMLYDLDNTSS